MGLGKSFGSATDTATGKARLYQSTIGRGRNLVNETRLAQFAPEFDRGATGRSIRSGAKQFMIATCVAASDTPSGSRCRHSAALTSPRLTRFVYGSREAEETVRETIEFTMRPRAEIIWKECAAVPMQGSDNSGDHVLTWSPICGWS